MGSEKNGKPDRREFMRRLGGAAVYGVPAFVALGAARPASSAEPSRESSPDFNPERIAMHWEEAARHLIEAERLGARTRFTDRDWEVLAPAVKGLTPPIKRWPPDWCAVC
jgi:hypothetical protein